MTAAKAAVFIAIWHSLSDGRKRHNFDWCNKQLNPSVGRVSDNAAGN